MENQNRTRRQWSIHISWLWYGIGLIIVLVGTAVLIYFNLLGSDPPIEYAVLETVGPLSPDTSAPDRTPESGVEPDFDSSYYRAVTAQITRIATEMEVPVVGEKTPVPVPTAIQRGGPVEIEVITVNAGLNVRSAPGIESPVIGVVAPGTRLRALALNPEQTWIQAHTEHVSEPGWVFAGLVRIVSGQLETLPTVPDAAEGTGE